MARTVNQREFEEKQKTIISMAVKIIGEKGYKRFSINQVISECDISKSSFFHHFKSKEMLIEAIINQIMAPIKKAYDKILNDEDSSSRKKVRDFFAIADKEKSKNELPVNNLMKLLYLEENTELFYKLVNQNFAICYPYFKEIVLRGCQSGEFTILHPLGTARHILRLALQLNEQIGRTMNSPESETTDWELLYEEILSFEHLTQMIFEFDDKSPLYGEQLHMFIREKLNRKGKEK